MSAEPELGSGRRRRGMPPGGPGDRADSGESARPATTRGEPLPGTPAPAAAADSRPQPTRALSDPDAAGRAAAGYAGAPRVGMSHRVLEPVAARVATLAEELRQTGYPVSQAELVQALIEFRLPGVGEAAKLVERWRALVNAVPPSPDR